MTYRFGLTRVNDALNKGAHMTRAEAKLIDAFVKAFRRAFST